MHHAFNGSTHARRSYAIIIGYEDQSVGVVSQTCLSVAHLLWGSYLPGFACFCQIVVWLAQWYIAVAKTVESLKPALEILDWASAHALHCGVMAEQVHPYTNEPLSVSPLTWRHATLVLTVHECLDRLKSVGKSE
jgi:GH15 family glucan-1,4-alpha-glucosidase